MRNIGNKTLLDEQQPASFNTVEKHVSVIHHSLFPQFRMELLGVKFQL